MTRFDSGDANATGRRRTWPTNFACRASTCTRPTQMPWALNKLHDMIASAQNMLDTMKAEMTDSAGRYVNQEANVLALARILNQTALAAEMGHSGQEAANHEGGDDATEA